MRTFLFILGLLVAVGPAAAVQPDEVLADPVLEGRAREISKDLRCLVCQNQSIDDSDAELARDLRVLVRERLVAGDGNLEVVDYIVSRYGDYVLLKPPFKAATLALWLGPAVLLLLGVVAVAAFYRRRRNGSADRPAAPLSEAEKHRLEELMKGDPT